MTRTTAALRSLGCAACGAPLVRRGDERTVRCRACGVRSVLVGVDASRRFQVVPRVSREAALATVRRALAKWPVREGTAQSAAFVGCEIVYVPFYEFEALQAGTVRRSEGVQFVKTGRVDWSEGRRKFVDAAGREISEAQSYERQRREVVDTAVILRTHRASGAAAGPSQWGLGAVDIAKLREDPDVRIVPFGAKEAAPGPALAPRRGRAEAEDDVRRMALATGAIDLQFLASDLRYVYVPVWAVRYRVDRHPYLFTVDASDGRVLAGRAPETPKRGALFVVLAAALIAFPLGKLIATLAGGHASDVGSVIRLAFEAITHLGVVSLLIPIGLLVPLAYAWGEFRFRGEVVFGPDGARVEKLARPATTAIERFVDKLVRQMDRAIAEREWGDA